MIDLRGLWSRHRRKIFVGLGVLGGGYALYKIYDAHRRKILELEKQLEGDREVNELVKSQLQTLFENIQRISDTTTLPYAMHFLRSKIAEDLDLSHLTEKLMLGKRHSSTLTSKEKQEKLELWERLKVLSFTRMATSLWGMTMLCLYVRVQVNILGRHLYLETARGLGSSQSLDEQVIYNSRGQQDFLSTADYLSTYSISTFISNMQSAAFEVLKEKQLKDYLSTTQLHETIIQILESFLRIGEPYSWINYLVPKDATTYRQSMAMSSSVFDDAFMLMDVSKLDQLMVETRTVLSSPDFGNIAEASLRKVVDVLMEDIDFTGANPSGIPLAKLLPRVAQLGPQLLEDPNNNKYVQMIRNLPEVDLFFTLLYANMPQAI